MTGLYLGKSDTRHMVFTSIDRTEFLDVIQPREITKGISRMQNVSLGEKRIGHRASSFFPMTAP